MPSITKSLSVFECIIDLRATGGSISITGGNTPSNASQYVVKPFDDETAAEVLQKLSSAIKNGKNFVICEIEPPNFIVKDTVHAIPTITANTQKKSSFKLNSFKKIASKPAEKLKKPTSNKKTKSITKNKRSK